MRGALALGSLVLGIYATSGLIASGLDVRKLSAGDFQFQVETVAPFGWLSRDIGGLWYWLSIAILGYLVYLLLQATNSRMALRRDSTSFSLSRHGLGTGRLEFSPSSEEAEFFADALIRPATVFRRITETVEPYTRSLLVKTTLTIRTDLTPESRVAVPVLHAERGRLEDGLRFYDASGQRVSSMTHAESLSYLFATIETLVMALGPTAVRRFNSTSQGESLSARVWKAVGVVTPFDELDEPQRQAQEAEISRLNDDIFRLSAKKDDQLLRIVDLIQSFRLTYPICIAVPCSTDTTRLTVERRVAPTLREFRFRAALRFELDAMFESLTRVGQASSRIVGRLAAVARIMVGTAISMAIAVWSSSTTRIMTVLRHWFGIRSNVLQHGLTNSARTSSYHLQIKGPGDMFVGTQGFASKIGARLARQRLEQIDYRVSEMAGQRHSHLHLQNGTDETRRLLFRVSFLERTPGSMARASLTAAAAAVIVGIIAVAQLGSLSEICREVGCSSSDAAPVPSDSTLLQVLLALPLAMTTASLGQGVSFWGGVLAARVANLATMIVCFVALVVSALPGRFSVTGLNQMWLGVAGAMVITTLLCVASWVWRANAHGTYVMSQKGED